MPTIVTIRACYGSVITHDDLRFELRLNAHVLDERAQILFRQIIAALLLIIFYIFLCNVLQY